jgi:hypothetical protein
MITIKSHRQMMDRVRIRTWSARSSPPNLALAQPGVMAPVVARRLPRRAHCRGETNRHVSQSNRQRSQPKLVQEPFLAGLAGERMPLGQYGLRRPAKLCGRRLHRRRISR